jgi:hypothetical protein
MGLFCVKTFLLTGALLTISFARLPEGNGESLLNKTTPSKKLHQLTTPEIDDFIKTLSQTRLTIAQKIASFSHLALGTPYVQGCLGEGSTGSYDKGPLIDFNRVDCTTFCEQILALAISTDYQDTFRNLQKIRYHNGIKSFTTRNHFIMADWLPNNKWLLKDITQEKGGSLCKEMVKTIDRSTFAASLGYDNVKGFVPPQLMSVHYLPKHHLLTIAPELRGSEIMVLITTRAGIFAAHLGFIIKNKDASLCFRHASSIKKKVIDEPLKQLSKRLTVDQHIAGIVLLEVRDDYLIPFERINDTLL